MQQLPLGWRWPAQQRFDTFHAGENRAEVALLRAAACEDGQAWVFVSGVAGCASRLAGGQQQVAANAD